MWLLVLLSLLLIPLQAQAASCGGGVVCRCGDTVTASYLMPADLSCPTGHGLRVGSNLTLNCQGHTVIGSNRPETYGLYLDQTSGTMVTNCHAYFWDRGIRLNGASFNVIQNVTAVLNGNATAHTGYGIDLAGGSTANFFLQVSSVANFDEGVHVGSGANENIFYQGEYCGNFRENLYFLSNRDNDVISVNVGHSCYGYPSGSNSIYMKDGLHNHFQSNVIRERPFHVTGHSVGTVVFNNQFVGTGYTEDCYVPTGLCPYLTIKSP